MAVFAKAPVPGFAKTRLIPALGPRGAAWLHRRLTRHALETALAAGLGPVGLWCAPDPGHLFLRRCARVFGVALYTQSGAGLGERMHTAFEATAVPALLIGTDCPALRPEHLRTCARRLLAGDDAVFLPAEDGGYVLVGLRQPRAQLFRGVDWGTDRVMDQTRERLREAGLSWREPCVLWDVDEPRDLARLRALERSGV